VYSNYLINKQAVDEGKQARVNYVGGSAATQDSSIILVNSVGPTKFIPSELDTILLITSSITVPDAPTNLTGTGEFASVNLVWDAPASNGGSEITYYTAISSPGGITATSTIESVTVTGLTPGVSYRFIVIATNARGDSPASYPSVCLIPENICDPPTNVTGVAGNSEVVVSWTPPIYTGFLPIIDYMIISNPGSFTVTSLTTSATVTGLANGTPYSFAVRARTSLGYSEYSTYSSYITPRTVPSAPRTVTAVAGYNQAVVSWLEPTSNGGSAIIDYIIISSPGGLTATSISLSGTIAGLSSEIPYTFTVVARNIAGNSVASSESSSVTPFTIPGQPTSVTAVAGNGQVVVSWTEPILNGGSAITEYRVTSSPGGLTATSSSNSATVTGLTNGTSYTFTVVAINNAGNSADSSPSSSVMPINKASYTTRILVLGDSTVSATTTALINSINTRGYTNITATAQRLSTTYTGTNLTKANFDVVLLWTNVSEMGQNGWETYLNSFVAAGGSVVCATFIWSIYTAGFDFTKTPFQANAQSNDINGTFTNNSVHPITTGVTPLSLGGLVLTNGTVALQSGATKISTYTTSGDPFIAVNTVGSSRLVGINAYIAPVSNSTTKAIVANSCLWAANVPIV